MTDLSALANALRRSLGFRIGVGVANPKAPAPPLWPTEEPATLRMRDTRRVEFAAGRAAARAAMTDQGLPQTAIPMGPDRAPHWPAGLYGSIAHCDRAAVAIVAPRTKVSGLGIDIEEDSDLSPDLWFEILTPDEHTWLRGQPRSEQGRRAKEIFCAKEAIHKLHHPITHRMLGFQEVTITLEPERFHTQLPIKTPALPPEISGKILRVGSLVSAVLVGAPMLPTCEPG